VTLVHPTPLPQRPIDARPPGPAGGFLKGNMPAIWRDPLGFFTDCAATYGDVALVRLGPRESVLLSHPRDIEDVLVTQNRKFVKHPAMTMNRYLLGNGLLVSEGDLWLSNRRLSQPAFLRGRVAGYAGAMTDLVMGMLNHWKAGEARDVHADMMQLSVAIVARLLFNADLGPAVAEVEIAQREVMEAYVSRYNSVFFLLSEKLPTPANLRMKRAANRLRTILERSVLDQQLAADGRDDLLGLFLRAHGDGSSHMTRRQLEDEVMNFFLAGHETSANGLAWALYLLASSHDVQSRLHAELDDVLQGRAPTVEDLPRLRFTERIVTEALRLYPPLWVIGRQALEDCEIGGYRVPAGTLVQMSQWVVHRDARWYADPHVFRPDRWAEHPLASLPRCAYFPFGAGARMCIGNNFALLEMALAIAAIGQRFRLHPLPEAGPTPLPAMTLRPANGIRLAIESRQTIR